MTDFIVLCETGEGPTGMTICGIIRAVEADTPEEEGDKAITQGMGRGEGTYLAVPLTDAVRRKAVDAGYVLEEPDEIVADPEPSAIEADTA